MFWAYLFFLFCPESVQTLVFFCVCVNLLYTHHLSYNIVILLQKIHFHSPAEEWTIIRTDRIVQSKQPSVLLSPLHAAVHLWPTCCCRLRHSSDNYMAQCAIFKCLPTPTFPREKFNRIRVMFFKIPNHKPLHLPAMPPYASYCTSPLCLSQPSHTHLFQMSCVGPKVITS